tara:strand:+ start:155 stop:565 length:411 start_codon:yes stop_codon:yes gene_type:complete
MKQLDELTIFQFPQMLKENCGMFIIEDLSSLEHEVKRIFIVSPDCESTRGDHAHLDCWQTLVCIRGSINVIVDDGIQKKKFILSEYGTAISVPPGFWCSQHYSTLSSLMVLCSHLYNEKDYVRDYDQYLQHRKIQE